MADPATTMVWTTLAVVLTLGAVAALGWTRLHTLAAYFQQEEYDNARYVRAWPTLSLVDLRFSAVVLVLGVVSVLLSAMAGDLRLSLWLAVAIAIVATIVTVRERGAQRAMKKPLVTTRRARRLIRLAAAIGAVGGFVLIGGLGWLGAIVTIQLLPLALVAANLALAPALAHENARYIAQARDKLARFGGVKIGITGSFGKTTVKHALGDALGQLSSVYYSTGSVNTVLGLTRHVRQRLQPAHRYFVAEMGAYGEGSIQRLCELVDPDHAIITSIGLAHNERFGGLEVVAQAKSELAAWVAAKGGFVVMTQDVARYAPFASIARAHPGQCVIVGADPDAPADYRIRQAVADSTGTRLILVRDGAVHDEVLALSLPLLGAHNADNLALIAALLLALGHKPDPVAAALGGVRHVPHRLAPRAGPGGATILDDAYNANPVGMRNAIDLAAQMAQRGGGRAFMITPGLVELGTRHDEEHRALGRYAAPRLEKTILVTPQRVPTFAHGVRDAGGLLKVADSYLAARAAIDPELGEGDVLLIANDLPDVLGRRVWL